MPQFVVAITGASGAAYAVRLLDVLLASGAEVHMTISPAGVQVVGHELGLPVTLNDFSADVIFPDRKTVNPESPLFKFLFATPAGMPERRWAIDAENKSDAFARLHLHHFQNFMTGIASGSFQTSGMVICPCSMGTLGSLASGLSSNLIHRAANVHLKERRPLIVVPRETPLDEIGLANMQTLSNAGVIVLPAMPGLYHEPNCLGDLIDFVVARICDQLGVEHQLMKRWGDSR